MRAGIRPGIVLLLMSALSGRLWAQVPATPPLVAGRMLERTCATHIPLVEGGQAACSIIHPSESGDWQTLARQVAEAIRSLGADDVPVIPDDQAVPQRLGPLRKDLQGRALILLGDVNSNRAIFPFYASYYTCCDARYPGGDGYELRTVVRPFGRSAACLIVGGSTRQGVSAGAARLVTRIRELRPGRDVVLSYCLEVRLGDELARLVAPAIAAMQAEPQSRPATDERSCGRHVEDFTRRAHLYFYTGDERFARRTRDLILAAAACRWDHSGFPTGDYTMENLAVAWRRASCSPAFSPADRATVDMQMYLTTAQQARAWWRIAPEQGIGNRHQTTGGLAFWTMLRTLRELGTPDARAAERIDMWYKEAEAYCDGLLRHYWDDEDDYQSADSAQNAASYAMQAGRLDWFDGGLARLAAERLLMTVDNLGGYAGIQGYGDALPGWERFALDAGLLLGACAFVYQDGSFLWPLQRFPGLKESWGSLQPWRLHQFATGDRLAPAMPSWLTGLRVARFTPYRLDRINSGEFLTTSIMDNFRPEGLAPRPVAPSLAFDKLVYRAGPDRTDLYLLLEGSAGSTLTTIDMNTLIRCTDAGRMWLVHNTGRRSLFFKNGVYVGEGANQKPMAPSGELMAAADFKTAALAVSRLPGCRGMTWTRHLFILPDRFTAVIDQLEAERTGEYTLCCGWRTPGYAALNAGRWEAKQDDVTFHLLPAVCEGVTSERPMRRDGATRPTVLRENRSLKAEPGDGVTFENVFYTSTPQRLRAFEVRRIAPGAILVRDVPSGSLVLAATGKGGVRCGGLESDAPAVLVTPADICLAAGKRCSFEGGSWVSPSGQIALTSDDSRRMQHALARLWQSAPAPVASQGAPAAAPAAAVPAGPEPAWRHGGPATRAGLIDGVHFVGKRNVAGLSLLATDWIMPLLRAEPRLLGTRGDELLGAAERQRDDDLGPLDAGPVLSPLRGAEFILELPASVPVSAIDFFGDTLGETADSLPPASLRVELTFTKDAFQADRRVRTLDLPRRESFHNLYKGHCYLFACFRAEGFSEDASAVRVRVLAGPKDSMILTDVQVRAPCAAARRLVEARPMDLDSDGHDEILIWTGEGDLAVLRPDGQEAWRGLFPQGILAVDAWDLDGDARREVFVSRLDRQVDVLNADGSPRWTRDFRDMKRESGGKFFGDGSAVYGMAVWQPATSQGPEVLFTSYWFSARLDPRGVLRECFRRGGHFTQIRQIPPGLPGAGGLAIRSDVPWPGKVPLQWWDAQTGQPAAEQTVPNGQAVFFELADCDADGKIEALAASEQGIGLYSPDEPRTRWEHMTDAPPVGVGVVGGPPGQPAKVVYGRQDGYVFVVSADGRVLASTVLDEPLRCLTAATGADGQPVVWAGTTTSLVALRWPDLAPVWRQPGVCQSLMLQRLRDRQRVLAVTVGGQITAFDPHPVSRAGP